FEIYGPCETGLEDLGLAIPNIIHRGPVHEATTDFTDYDGFIFTSLFEGMPNVVLEMSQYAIPMVLADVGDLRMTFDDSAVLFVRHGSSADDTAANFGCALDRIAVMTAEEITKMVEAARNQALIRHAPIVHARGVAELFHFV